MASKTISWADQSGDVITLSAPAWSGTQTVTLSTPENFGVAREINIVFYSEANPSVSATLNVKQSGATASVSPSSITFLCDEVAPKTITIQSNVSSLATSSVSLSGKDANQFTVSSISPISNGKATFTITPKNPNTGDADLTCSILVKVGRLSSITIPVVQESDAVKSVEYTNYRIQNPIILSSEGNIKEPSYLFPASSEPLSVFGTAIRDRVVTYVSGKKVTTTENVPDDEELTITLQIQQPVSGQSEYRATVDVVSNQEGLSAGVPFNSIPSLGYNIVEDGTYGFYLKVSSSTATSSSFSLYGNVNCQGNKRESYSNFSATNFPGKVVGAESQSVTISGVAFGTCKYTSGSSRNENVPLLFEEESDWISILSQTPAEPGLYAEESSAEIQVDANEGMERFTLVSVYPRMIDGSKGGDLIGNFPISQVNGAAGYGTLSVRVVFPYPMHCYLAAYYGSFGVDRLLSSIYVEQSQEINTFEGDSDFINILVDTYGISPRSEDVLLAYVSSIRDESARIFQSCRISPAKMDSLKNNPGAILVVQMKKA